MRVTFQTHLGGAELLSSSITKYETPSRCFETWGKQPQKIRSVHSSWWRHSSERGLPRWAKPSLSQAGKKMSTSSRERAGYKGGWEVIVPRCTAGLAPGVQLLFPLRRWAAWEQNSWVWTGWSETGAFNSSEISPTKECFTSDSWGNARHDTPQSASTQQPTAPAKWPLVEESSVVHSLFPRSNLKGSYFILTHSIVLLLPHQDSNNEISKEIVCFAGFYPPRHCRMTPLRYVKQWI